MKKQPSSTTVLGWNFPVLNGGDIKGFHDAVQEYFQGKHAQIIAREVIQNSLDARKDDGKPVEVEFEKFTAPIESLVGLKELADIFPRAKSFADGQAGADEFYASGMEQLKKKELSVLRISDYNTKGIVGQDREHLKPWCQLTSSVGISIKKGGQGGTFGIGKGAPFVASKLRTIYYLTLNEENESIFMGKCRISSYEDKDKDLRDGVGNFGVLQKSLATSIRDKSLIPEIFKERKQTGTDIYIVGYDGQNEDWQKDMIVSVLENFWAAIHFEDLVVRFIDGKSRVEINKSNLEKTLHHYDGQHNALPFFEAATSSSSFKREKNLPTLGKVQFFVALADDFPKKIQLMRGSKMLIDYYPAKILRDGYAGVFICTSKTGNDMLRGLEPPAHDKWIPERQEYGSKVIREMYSWIKECLKELAGKTTSKPDEIPDLNKYLPEEGEEDDEPIAAGQNVPKDDDRESSKEKGKEKEREEIEPSYSVKKSVGIRKVGEGDQSGPTVKKKKGGSNGGGGTSTQAGSQSRIDTSNVRFRSFVVPSKKGQGYQLLLVSEEDQEGDLKIIASGEDAEYDADLIDAVGMDDGRTYPTKDSFIKGLKLKAGKPLRLQLSINSKRRYILAIESHGS